jgi:threonyl-tRNA synthetase
VQAGCVAVRTRTGEDLGSMLIEAFIERIKSDIASKV